MNAAVQHTPPAEETHALGHLEANFDPAFASRLALREKQIQQNYRPIIGIHKWFARRPGTLFRSLLLAEFVEGPVSETYWQGHACNGTIADPFMGGGTTLYEASRIGLNVIGNDINAMSHWLVDRAFESLDIEALKSTADEIVVSLEEEIGGLYQTSCLCCGESALVKYFIWVKSFDCPSCATAVDAFPGHLLAENKRHPYFVVGCGTCGHLNEYASLPDAENPETCSNCRGRVVVQGNARKGKVDCPQCHHTFAFPIGARPPRHRLWAIEYWCRNCYPSLKGRQFKSPDSTDLAKVESASLQLTRSDEKRLIPNDTIPDGDETARLHRWGYDSYFQMFNERQLLVLSKLASRINAVPDKAIRKALLTVLSDILRYNNMLCRYDTYALKCQDIFSVHGFPVGLVQCENNVFGIPRVGSGGFRHFVEKYARAKEYAAQPFEMGLGKKREVTYPHGEHIGVRAGESKYVALSCAPSQSIRLKPDSLDGVFTDPPYFANVQYSELIDFCYVWLKSIAGPELGEEFAGISTRSAHEATGNVTAGRGVNDFASALSQVFVTFTRALKPGAPLVFTYHHNDPLAYVPLVVAVLNSGFACTAVFPAAGEMSASTHIANTSSSVLDSVFVCRRYQTPLRKVDCCVDSLADDYRKMLDAGIKVSRGDLRCLLAGRVAASAINGLAPTWSSDRSVVEKMATATEFVSQLLSGLRFEELAAGVVAAAAR